MNFFFLPKHTFLHHLQKIYMACYLLTWTYFNDVNGGRNILINSQLQGILFISGGKKKWNKTEKDRKNMGKKIDGIDLVEMRYQIQVLWSLLNLNEKQTSEILIVVAVMMRKKVQKQSSGGVCSWFCRINVLRKFAKFTEKHLWQSLLFNKGAGFLRNF